MLTSLTNFVGNLGHCGCLSVILIWNGGVVWPESELQRDRMLGREALNRNMCLRRKRSSHWPKLFLWTNQRSWLGELPSLPVWSCGWAILILLCGLDQATSAWQEHLTVKERTLEWRWTILSTSTHQLSWAVPWQKLFLGLSPETHDLKFRQTPTLLM